MSLHPHPNTITTIGECERILKDFNVPSQKKLELIHHLNVQERIYCKEVRAQLMKLRHIQQHRNKFRVFNRPSTASDYVEPLQIVSVSQAQTILQNFGIQRACKLSKFAWMTQDDIEYVERVKKRLNYLQKNANDRKNRKPTKRHVRLDKAWRAVQISAKNTNVALQITKQEVMEIVKNPCNYCGATIHITCDRIDSNWIYEKSNILPACHMCNRMKAGHLPNIFIGLAQVIYQHQQDKSWKFNGLYKAKKITQHRSYVKLYEKLPKKVVTLTEAEYTALLDSDCVFCGTKQANGIDRIDSSKPHCNDNCQSCCATCNWMKNHFEESTFLSKIEQIATSHQKIDVAAGYCAICSCYYDGLCFDTNMCCACYFNKHFNPRRDLSQRPKYVHTYRKCTTCLHTRPNKFFIESSQICVDCN
jgi:hypothetical protein